MVNRGPSKGCWTCRKRRVKCDEGKPSCHQCSRLGRECGGYEPATKTREIRFRSYGKGCRSTVSKLLPRPRAGVVPVALIPSDESLAIGFFITSIVGLGRGYKSTQGFLEPLLPVVAREHPSSVLSTVVSAVSTKFWAFFKDPATTYDSPHSPFNNALAHLQIALNDPVERAKDSTIFSVILMHFYESIAARSTHRPTIRAHQDGARALLEQQPAGASQTACGAYLKGYLRHCDISTYLETQDHNTAELETWFDAGWNESMPANPNAILDLIGLALADLQMRLADIKGRTKLDLLDSDIEAWWRDLKSVEAQLSDWILLVPPGWQPHTRKMYHGPSYLGACDLYPTVQIATIWNVWRVCRLMALRMRLSLQSSLQHEASHQLESMEVKVNTSSSSNNGRELIDAICRSLPFFLGNRQSHGGLNDLVDEGIIIPSYHDADLDEEVRAQYIQGDDAMSAEDYKKHILVQGPSHALLHLNSLIKVLSSDGGNFICRQIGADQVVWIREQFLRVCRLTNSHM